MSKTYSQLQRTFYCPRCNNLLCSKGSTKNSTSAAGHFKKEHPEYSSKTHCLVCLVENPSTEHRFYCLQHANAMKKEIVEVVQPRIDNYQSKKIIDSIQTLLTKKILHETFYEESSLPIEANLVKDFELTCSAAVEPGQPNFHQITSFDLIPNVNFNTTFFYEYTKTCYSKADPSTAIGKAIQLLTSYQEGKYFHLVVCYEHLEQFKSACDDSADLIRPTPFYCFCNSTNLLKNKSVERVLHLHLLAYISNMEEFRKRIWNKLAAKKQARYKSCHSIQNVYHFYNCILYISQRKSCGGSDSGKKHFLMNTFLSPTDELQLAMIFPVIALQIINQYSKIKHLTHYDIYFFGNNDCRSKLEDVLSQIDLFDNLLLPQMIPDITNERIIIMPGRITAKEFLMQCLNADSSHCYYIRWKKTAQQYCKTLFQFKTIPHHNTTTEFSVRLHHDSDEEIIQFVNETSSKRKKFILDGDYLKVIFNDVAKNSNVKIIGSGNDIRGIKRLLKGWYYDSHSFTAISGDTFYQIYYEITDGEFLDPLLD